MCLTLCIHTSVHQDHINPFQCFFLDPLSGLHCSFLPSPISLMHFKMLLFSSSNAKLISFPPIPGLSNRFVLNFALFVLLFGPQLEVLSNYFSRHRNYSIGSQRTIWDAGIEPWLATCEISALLTKHSPIHLVDLLMFNCFAL